MSRWMRVIILAVSLIIPVLEVYTDEGGSQMILQKRDAKAFFNALNKDTMYLCDEFYAQDAEFFDPLVHFTNREDIKTYYGHFYKDVDEVKFDFSSVVDDGDEQVAVWVMTLKSKKLNKGRPVAVEGVSHIRYNAEGKAVYHRDYFDLGKLFYSNVPFVRGMIRFINTRVRKKHDPTFYRKIENPK